MKVIIENIKKSYSNRFTLDIGKLELAEGRIYGILGPNGSGKTTLLRLISGLEKPDNGKISYGSEFEAPSGEVAFLLQNSYLFDFSVLENVLLGTGGKSTDDQKLAMDALREIGMEKYANVRASTLSGGEAQKVAIARTLVRKRRLVLLDEPTASVDIYSMRQVEDFIKKFNKNHNATVVISTHNPSQAARIADEVVIMWNGCIIERGSPESVFSSPCREETRQFLENWRI
ncbi:MAG TPA: ABC transporter ATP-binding protein [Clostridiaceae bacterium]|nr:ABC transporter ATP-binding protein [Clostridiaceae bacterium]